MDLACIASERETVGLNVTAKLILAVARFDNLVQHHKSKQKSSHQSKFNWVVLVAG